MPEAEELVLKVKSHPKPFAYKLGDKVYVAEQKNYRVFHQKCPVCGGTKKVVYNGYELRCTYCDKVPAAITVHDFTVREYIVYEITVKSPLVKYAYEKKNIGKPEFLPEISGAKAFYSSGDESDVISVPRMEGRTDVGYGRFAFTTKKAASEYVKGLMENEKMLLAKFNEEHGTDYEYPFGDPAQK